MNIKDMTDSHIANAIAYCEKRRNFHAVELLTKEKQRREDEKLFGVKIECPFCKDTMIRKVYESDPEEGPGVWWIKCAFTCNKCGARGPLQDKHELKTIQRSTTERTETGVRRNQVVLGRRVKARPVL